MLKIFKNTLFGLLVSLLWLSNGLFAQAQRIHHVTPSGSGDGNSWSSAASFTVALTAASSGDQIWLMGGTYTPHASDRDISFMIPGGVFVYGGFAGTEATFDPESDDSRPRDEAGVLSSPTILTGNIGDQDSNEDNTKTVVRLTGPNVSLNGLMIRDGYDGTTFIVQDNQGNDRKRVQGAGLLANMGTAGAKLTDCHFSSHAGVHPPDSPSGLPGRIGALYGAGAFFRESATFTGCSFSDCDGVFGTGLLVMGDATLTDCRFSNNQGLTGVGMFVGGRLTATNCTFSRNVGIIPLDGIGMYAEGEATLTNCTFSNNSGGLAGRGAYLKGNAVVTNCTFNGNVAVPKDRFATFVTGKGIDFSDHYGGGGIYFEGDALVTGCTFRDNSAVRGGAITHGKSSDPTITIMNSFFHGNKAILASSHPEVPPFTQGGGYCSANEQCLHRQLCFFKQLFRN